MYDFFCSLTHFVCMQKVSFCLTGMMSIILFLYSFCQHHQEVSSLKLFCMHGTDQKLISFFSPCLPVHIRRWVCWMVSQLWVCDFICNVFFYLLTSLLTSAGESYYLVLWILHACVAYTWPRLTCFSLYVRWHAYTQLSKLAGEF